MTIPAIFLIKIASPEEIPSARLLIESLQSFGGVMRDCPIWLYATRPQVEPCLDLASEQVKVIPLTVPETIQYYPFSSKVFACAKAEEAVPSEVNSLIWMDLDCLIAQPPILYDLGDDFDATFRPVHHRNVGSLQSEPPDGFWKGIYHAVGVQNVDMTVDTFIGREHLRAYFNSHIFSIRPGLGILHRWLDLFERLVLDQTFQQTACRDEIHKVFLFQALLSTLVATSLDRHNIRILPPTYNYPYSLHNQVDNMYRPKALNDLVSLVFEGRDIRPEAMKDIEVREPLRSWLGSRITA